MPNRLLRMRRMGGLWAVPVALNLFSAVPDVDL